MNYYNSLISSHSLRNESSLRETVFFLRAFKSKTLLNLDLILSFPFHFFLNLDESLNKCVKKVKKDPQYKERKDDDKIKME